MELVQEDHSVSSVRRCQQHDAGVSAGLVEDIGAEVRTVKKGDLVHIPASVFHQTVNTGAGTMELLAVYSPCGPEEVIRALPDHQQLPAGPWPG